MSLKFGLQVLLESCYIFFMKKVTGPINGLQYVISNNVVCASTKGLVQPAHMCSLIRAFASRLKILTFEVS